MRMLQAALKAAAETYGGGNEELAALRVEAEVHRKSKIYPGFLLPTSLYCYFFLSFLFFFFFFFFFQDFP